VRSRKRKFVAQYVREPCLTLKSGAQSAGELQSCHMFRNLQPYNLADVRSNRAVACSTGAAYGRSTSPRVCVSTVAHIYILLVVVPRIFSTLTAGLHPIVFLVTTTTAAQYTVVLLVGGIRSTIGGAACG